MELNEKSGFTYRNLTQTPDIRELTVLNGLSYPTEEELIMLILGRGSKDNPISRMAEEVNCVIKFSERDKLVQNLMQINGMGLSRALCVAAAVEFGRRNSTHLGVIISKPQEIVPYVKQYALKSVEHFIVVTLNGSQEIIDIHPTSIGTVNRTLIHPREVFAHAITEHASAIICCHNHPCDKCYPSAADIDSTKMLSDAAQMLGIHLLDHIIITKTGYFSFLENNML